MTTLHFDPVLTAHPTEPTRRTILRREQDIVRRLLDMQNTVLAPIELTADLNNIRDDITAIWQTEEHTTEARTVTAEHEHVLFFLTDCIYRVIPATYETVQGALAAVWGAEGQAIEVPMMISIGSAIGGDMVGRPEITARSIRATLERQRSLVLNLYYGECKSLAEKMSQGASRVQVSPELLQQTAVYARHFPNALSITPLRHREMPYRVFLRLVMARLQSTFSEDLYPYANAEEFLADLALITASLVNHKGQHAGLFAVRRLSRRVATFGFHFITLDIRQDALANRRIVGRCLEESGWLEQSPEYRLERIRQALRDNESPLGELENEAKRTIGIFRAIGFCRRHFGRNSIGPYIISGAEGVDDVLSVLLLAQWGVAQKKRFDSFGYRTGLRNYRSPD